MQKVIVILGQTTSGKSALAVRLARIFGGEVISSDSRQVYKGLDIGTAKITPKEMRGVPHHLIDIANPKKQFTVAQFKKLAEKKIKEILGRKKIPILCGGTGFYIDAVTKNIVLPKVPPDKKLRKDLGKENAEHLLKILKKLDATRAKTVDPKNKVRIIRAIEIAKYLGKVPSLESKPSIYEFLKIGLKLPEEKLKRKIKAGLKKRIRGGMAVELYALRQRGVPWKRFMELGFDQKYIALYLQRKINEKEMLDNQFLGNWQYAKRQMTWFKRDPEIHWFDPSLGTYKDIKKEVQEFLLN
jgi:tRNA dimethylallyltransferase